MHILELKENSTEVKGTGLSKGEEKKVRHG